LNLKSLHQQFPVWWLVDTLPIFGLISGYFASYSNASNYEVLSQEAENIKEKTKTISSYTKKLAKGDLKFEIDIDDAIGKSIKNLQESLIKSQEESARHKLEEAHHNWATEGLTIFAEILRKNNEDIEELSFEVLSKLIKYTGANQGGFFVLEDEDEANKYFTLTASYAYERKKFTNKKVAWAEGLIGTCALEMEPILMTDVPSDYVHITSGLGESTPRCIYIVPLILNDTIQGVIELASFKVFEKFEQEFIIKLAESIASTIFSVKNNMRTAILLKQSKEQADNLTQQEEKLRENLEMLRTTQEQAAIQAKQFENFVNSVNQTMMSAEFTPAGILQFANQKFLQKLSFKKIEEVEGKNVFQFINERDAESFNEIWTSLKQGQQNFEGELKLINKYNEDFWTVCTFISVINDDKSIEKILFLATDIHEQKEKNLDYQGQIDAVNIASMKAEFNTSGHFILANNAFTSTIGINKEDLTEKTFFDLLTEDEIESFKTKWEDVLQDTPYKGQEKLLNSNGEEKWFQITIAPVKDVYGTVIKVVIIANDITEQKLMELETQRQSKILKDQEEKLKQSQIDLEKKLEEARKEMKGQFHEMETIKIRNEKTLEGALDAIISFNQNGFIQFFNRAAEGLLGYEKAEVIQQQISMIFTEDAEERGDFTKGIITAGTNKPVGYRQEVTLKSKSGEELNVLVLLSEAEVHNAYTYTAFIQTIEVELF